MAMYNPPHPGEFIESIYRIARKTSPERRGGCQRGSSKRSVWTMLVD